MKQNIVTTKRHFEEKWKKNQIFQSERIFPYNTYNSDFKDFIFFQSDFVYTKSFFESLLTFIRNIGDANMTFYSVSPDANEYFCYHFKKYGIAMFSLSDTYETYKNTIWTNYATEDGIFDSLIISGETIVLFSDSLKWGIVASKDWEIGVIGFSNDTTKKMFDSVFKDDIGEGKIFDALDSYMTEYSEMFHWDNETITKWNNLKKLYPLLFVVCKK